MDFGRGADGCLVAALEACEEMRHVGTDPGRHVGTDPEKVNRIKGLAEVGTQMPDGMRGPLAELRQDVVEYRP